jgi:hypothetical protein
MASRVGPLLLLGALAAAAYVWLGPHVPKDQSVNVILGDSAPTVTEVALQYAANGEPVREAVLRYELGRAPRVVHHEPRLPDGAYVVDVRVHGAHGVVDTERHVELHASGSTSITLKDGS